MAIESGAGRQGGVTELEKAARKAIDECPRCRKLTERERATRAVYVAIDVLRRRRACR